jgi:hypothetical protein
MRIRFSGIDTQLPTDIVRRPSSDGGHDGTFWVIHPPETPTVWLHEAPDTEEYRGRGNAFLFISGNGLGGFGWVLDGLKCAEELEKEWKDRVHCLRPACSERTIAIHQQIAILLSEVEKLDAGAAIPWWIVRPAATHENLLALYLLGLAAAGMDSDQRRAFQEFWAIVAPDWKQVLLERASSEYVDVTEGELLDFSRITDAIPVSELLPDLRQVLTGHVGTTRS